MHPDEARDRWKVSYGNIQSSPITFHRGKPSTCNAAHQVQVQARLDTIRLAHGLGPYRLGVRRALALLASPPMVHPLNQLRSLLTIHIVLTLKGRL